MKRYVIMKKGLFEKFEAFEDRISNNHGYEAINISNDGATVIVLMKKISQPMAKKKAFALRVDEKMLAALEKWAADEFRSTNGQIEYLLSEALKKAKREPKKDNK